MHQSMEKMLIWTFLFFIIRYNAQWRLRQKRLINKQRQYRYLYTPSKHDVKYLGQIIYENVYFLWAKLFHKTFQYTYVREKIQISKKMQYNLLSRTLGHQPFDHIQYTPGEIPRTGGWWAGRMYSVQCTRRSYCMSRK